MQVTKRCASGHLTTLVTWGFNVSRLQGMVGLVAQLKRLSSRIPYSVECGIQPSIPWRKWGSIQVNSGGVNPVELAAGAKGLAGMQRSDAGIDQTRTKPRKPARLNAGVEPQRTPAVHHQDGLTSARNQEVNGFSS